MVSEGADRFRLSIVFTERDALLDFVALLKRQELLTGAAQARRVEALSVVEPATEEWVITDAQRR
jgi:hypothetical protein